VGFDPHRQPDRRRAALYADRRIPGLQANADPGNGGADRIHRPVCPRRRDREEGLLRARRVVMVPAPESSRCRPLQGRVGEGFRVRRKGESIMKAYTHRCFRKASMGIY
jgi:hypothetical protein